MTKHLDPIDRFVKLMKQWCSYQSLRESARILDIDPTNLGRILAKERTPRRRSAVWMLRAMIANNLTGKAFRKEGESILEALSNGTHKKATRKLPD